MSLTQNWTEKNYLDHIIKNKLDNIWSGYCTPKSVEGIRLATYTPIYSDDLAKYLKRKCTRKGCTGQHVVPLDDRINKIIYKTVCNGTINGSACGAYRMVLYRWVSANDQTKLWFSSPETVRHYGSIGRTFYATLSIYDRRILPKSGMYVNESLMMAHTLGMDIDIKRGHGTIYDSENRIQIDKVLDIVRQELNTFAGESFNLQTSGNGVYIFIHHNLVKTDIFNQMARFNSWINYLNGIIKSQGITRIKIDPLNMPSRVFKLVGSIHQRSDLVCIPLDFDCRLSLMNGDEFKLENFDINKYIVDGKLKFYNRYNINEKKSLYDFLDEHTQKHPQGDLRAIRYNFKENVGAITGEEQKDETKEEQEDLKSRIEANNFSEYYTGWNPLGVDIPGRVIHKVAQDGRHHIEMLGVDEQNIDKILDKIWGPKEVKETREGKEERELEQKGEK